MDTTIRPVSVVLLLGPFGDGVGVSACSGARGIGKETSRPESIEPIEPMDQTKQEGPVT